MRCWAEIDLSAFRDNVRLIQERIGRNVSLMAVVKADGYGHGAVMMARQAADLGCWAVGVVDAGEALALRDSGFTGRIVVLGGMLPEEFEDAVAARAQVTVSDARDFEPLDRAARRAAVRMGVHLKVDTGMGRWGGSPEALPAMAQDLARYENLEAAGISTHLSSPGDEIHTRGQLERFRRAVNVVRARGLPTGRIHAANSNSTLLYPDAHFQMVRCGIGIYGLDSGLFERGGFRPRPVLSLRARVALVKQVPAGAPVGYDGRHTAERPERLAVVTAGYADGVPHRLTNAGEVLIRGKRARIVGKVMMDTLLADVTRIRGAAAGDTVTIVGADGKESIRVEDVARVAGTIPYEIPCRLGPRVGRVYTASGRGRGFARWAAVF